MKPEFWEERWRTSRIGFHQAEANALLRHHFGTLALEPGATVFVPLCGKSLDMLWLRDEGYHVIGVEFVEKAVEDFFAENDLTFERTSEGPFARYRSEGLELLCGNFFDLDRGHLADVRGVYDRAALIALPPEMRRRYAKHLTSILPPGWRMLLMTIDYDQTLKSGPPFAVSADEVRSLYGTSGRVELLERNDILETSPRFQEREVPHLFEEAWAITAD
ncbi:MAG TPA: thiopurine S-methyltransferase [Candidatus Kapabacteria bacterium]|jgi:thiopurine S-methyltransferase|nr:thiopurine S-methyltransferase [Candidatus Kapabacteria bacterium]